MKSTGCANDAKKGRSQERAYLQNPRKNNVICTDGVCTRLFFIAARRAAYFPYYTRINLNSPHREREKERAALKIISRTSTFPCLQLTLQFDGLKITLPLLFSRFSSASLFFFLFLGVTLLLPLNPRSFPICRLTRVTAGTRRVFVQT